MNTNSLNDFFPSIWLKGDDIPDTQNLILTIKSLDWEEIGFERESKPVMSFIETNKKLVLNKTNGKTLQSLFGTNVVDFIGKKIALFKTPVEFQGKSILGVRIRSQVPQSKDDINETLQEEEFEIPE